MGSSSAQCFTISHEVGHAFLMLGFLPEIPAVAPLVRSLGLPSTTEQRWIGEMLADL